MVLTDYDAAYGCADRDHGTRLKQMWTKTARDSALDLGCGLVSFNFRDCSTNFHQVAGLLQPADQYPLFHSHAICGHDHVMNLNRPMPQPGSPPSWAFERSV